MAMQIFFESPGQNLTRAFGSQVRIFGRISNSKWYNEPEIQSPSPNGEGLFDVCRKEWSSWFELCYGLRLTVTNPR